MLIILAAYSSTLKFLIMHDWALEDYSHCFLIPFVFLYLLWEKRHELAVTPAEKSWIGFIPLALGILLFWLGELGGEYFTTYISLWLVFSGLLWIHLGWQKIKIMAFPLFVLLAMFPFPNFINSKLLLKLKLLSSQIGVSLLQLYGMSAYREGNIIDLGFTQLQVVDACSGLRYVLPSFVIESFTGPLVPGGDVEESPSCPFICPSGRLCQQYPHRCDGNLVSFRRRRGGGRIFS